MINNDPSILDILILCVCLGNNKNNNIFNIQHIKLCIYTYFAVADWSDSWLVGSVAGGRIRMYGWGQFVRSFAGPGLINTCHRYRGRNNK